MVKFIKVRDHIPLEQGLRRAVLPSLVYPSSVRDHIPLEQGLRLDNAGVSLTEGLSETIFH